MDAGTAALNLHGREFEQSWSKLLTWTTALAVAVVPLLIDLSNLDDTYYAGKARALSILAPVIVAGLLASRGIPVLRRTRLLVPLIVFVTAAALATVFSVNPQWSVVGAPRRHEGLLSLVAYAVLCAGTLVVVARGGLRIWLAAVLAGGTLTGLYGIAQYFGYEPLVRDSVRVDWWRPFSTTGNPNFLGAYMVLISPLAAAALLTARRRLVMVLSSGVLAVAVLAALCTYSRAAWLGLAVAAVVFGILSARRAAGMETRSTQRTAPDDSLRLDQRRPVTDLSESSGARLAGACALVVALAGMFFASGGPLANSRADWPAAQRARTSIDAGDPQGGLQWRLFFWRHTLQLLARRPVLGYGPETLALVFPQGWDAERSRLFGEMTFTPPRVDKAHNETLDMAMSTGVLGLAAFWWVVVSAARAGRMALSAADTQWVFAAACLAAMAGYLFDVQWHFSVVSVAPVFWSVMGAVSGMGIRASEGPRGPNPIPLSLEGEGRVRGPEEPSLLRKGSRSDGGFNFIEVIVAVALMGILAVISLTSMKKYSARRDMVQGARQIAGDLRLTQQFAMTQDQNFRLVYAPSSTSSYTIVKVSDGSVSKYVLLPSTLTVTSTGFTSNTAEFAATGAPVQSGTFCVSASGVSTIMSVTVLAGTGRTTDQEVSTCP